MSHPFHHHHHHHHQPHQAPNPNLGEIISFLNMINPGSGSAGVAGGNTTCAASSTPVLGAQLPGLHNATTNNSTATYPNSNHSLLPPHLLPPSQLVQHPYPSSSTHDRGNVNVFPPPPIGEQFHHANGSIPSSPISVNDGTTLHRQQPQHQVHNHNNSHNHPAMSNMHIMQQSSPPNIDSCMTPSSSVVTSEAVESSVCGSQSNAKDKPYACSRCDMRFKSLLRLEEHVQAHEQSDMRYSCLHPGCSRTFNNHIYLANHMRRHGTVDKPHTCTLCPKTFKQRAGLLAHMDIHEGKRPHQCPECEKAFRQKTTLEQHRRMHTGERPYECTFCDKSFRQRSHLDQHIRTHTGEKPYQCMICVKSFKQKSGLDNHVRTHTGEKPYRCAVCGTTYKQRSGLLNHMKSHEDNSDRQTPGEVYDSQPEQIQMKQEQQYPDEIQQHPSSIH